MGGHGGARLYSNYMWLNYIHSIQNLPGITYLHGCMPILSFFGLLIAADDLLSVAAF